MGSFVLFFPSYPSYSISCAKHVSYYLSMKYAHFLSNFRNYHSLIYDDGGGLVNISLVDDATVSKPEDLSSRLLSR